MKVEMWPTDRPIPYGRNARIISEKAVDKVAASIKEFGFRQPIVVDSAERIIIGHVRQRAAKKLGLPEVPVHVADNLTAAQVKALRLMDNRSHEETSWVQEFLVADLTELQGLATGFDPDELALLTQIDTTMPLAMDPPPTVVENLAELDKIRAARNLAKTAVVAKNDTDRYLVIVFRSRAERERSVSRLGFPSDERYLSWNSVTLLRRSTENEAHDIGVAAKMQHAGANG